MALKAKDMQVDSKSLTECAYDAYRDYIRAKNHYTRSVTTWEHLQSTTQCAWAVAIDRVLELTEGLNV